MYYDNETEFLKYVKNYLLELKELYRTNQKEGMKEAKEALIRTGVLTKKGKPKKHIVTESHVGYDRRKSYTIGKRGSNL